MPLRSQIQISTSASQVTRHGLQVGIQSATELVPAPSKNVTPFSTSYPIPPHSSYGMYIPSTSARQPQAAGQPSPSFTPPPFNNVCPDTQANQHTSQMQASRLLPQQPAGATFKLIVLGHKLFKPLLITCRPLDHPMHSPTWLLTD